MGKQSSTGEQKIGEWGGGEREVGEGGEKRNHLQSIPTILPHFVRPRTGSLPANTAASHSLPLLRAKRVSHIVAGANERRLFSQATEWGAMVQFDWLFRIV